MSLVECPECGKSVSSRAVACPGCGCPIGNDPTLEYLEKRARTGLTLCIILLIVGLLFFGAALLEPKLLVLAVLCGLPGFFGIFVHGLRLAQVRESRNNRNP